MEQIRLLQLTNYIKEIKLFSEKAENLIKSINKENLKDAKLISAKLKSVLSRYTTELNNYLKVCEEPDIEEISEFSTCQIRGEELYIELEVNINELVEINTTTTNEVHRPSYSKLPELHLPRFDGDLLKWYQFWDQFTSNINRRKLDDVDKLLYLKSSLEGDAARLIDGLDATNTNYQIAVDILKSRYGKENEIIHSHHRAINNLPCAKNLKDCREILDELEIHLRVLKSLNEDINAKHMQYIILGKFPAEIVYETNMRIDQNGNQNVENIMKQLTVIISTKEEASKLTEESTTSQTPQYTVETLLTTKVERKPTEKHYQRQNQIYQGQQERRNNFQRKTHYPNRNNQHNNQHRSQTYKRKSNNTPDQREYPYSIKRVKNEEERICAFCKRKNHTSEMCETYKSIFERKKKLGAKCYNCLKIGHQTIACHKENLCKKCETSYKHHPSLCNAKYKETASREPTKVMHINQGNSTILQTAIVKIKGNQGEQQEVGAGGEGACASTDMVSTAREWARPVTTELEALASFKKLLEIQNTFRPVFAPLLRCVRPERKRVTALHRMLADAGLKYDTLKDAWANEQYEGLEKSLKPLTVTAKEEDIKELLEIFDCHFDPAKEAKGPKPRTPTKPRIKSETKEETGEGSTSEGSNSSQQNSPNKTNNSTEVKSEVKEESSQQIATGPVAAN